NSHRGRDLLFRGCRQAARWYSLMTPPEDASSPYGCVHRHDDIRVVVGWTLVQARMWPGAVEMPLVGGQRGAGVPLVVDQQLRQRYHGHVTNSALTCNDTDRWHWVLHRPQSRPFDRPSDFDFRARTAARSIVDAHPSTIASLCA